MNVLQFLDAGDPNGNCLLAAWAVNKSAFVATHDTPK